MMDMMVLNMSIYIYIYPFQIKHGYFGNLAVKLPGVYIHNYKSYAWVESF